jgi:hypothetical protein
MRRGARLYLDVVDHKPPLIYFIYQAGFALTGAFSTLGAHLFVVLAVLTTAAILYAIAGRGPAVVGTGEGDRKALALIAAALFLVFSTTWHDYDALAANCELFLLVPQALAGWLVLRASPAPFGTCAPDDARPGAAFTRSKFCASHVAIGALIGLSALCKYQGLTFLGVSVGFLVIDVARRRVPLGWAVVALGLEGLGVALPIGGFLLWARAQGSLAATIDWFRFNFLYVGAGLTGAEAARRGFARLGLIGAAALPVYVPGILGAVVTARAWLLRLLAVARGAGASASGETTPTPSGAQRLGLLWLLTSVIALCAGGRFFGHYFHLILAPLALLAAPVFLSWWRRSSVARVLLTAAGLVPALAFFLLATVGRQQAAALDEGEPDYERVAAQIAAQSTPHDRMFVWGNSPQLYILARRSMGTRFSFCNYMTGESPGTGTETGAKNADANVLPVSWTMLFEDLEQRRPALFVDAAAAGWDGYDKYPISRYPQLAAYLAGHYRQVGVVDHVVIYRRSP